MAQHFAPYPGPSFACGADATGQRNSRLDQDHHATTCMRCLASDAWVAAADAAGTGAEPKTLRVQNRYEPVAHNQRNSYISAGYLVSLIGYNPESDAYEFDVYPKAQQG
jgi:hypothetical protein